VAKISKKQKDILRQKLYQRDYHQCHYCQISEKDVIPIWDKFYGQDKRDQCLEVDRKDNEKGYSMDNCVLACAVCNCAKSNKFTYVEFLKVGAVIKEIWQQRQKRRSRKLIQGL